MRSAESSLGYLAQETPETTGEGLVEDTKIEGTGASILQAKAKNWACVVWRRDGWEILPIHTGILNTVKSRRGQTLFRHKLKQETASE